MSVENAPNHERESSPERGQNPADDPLREAQRQRVAARLGPQATRTVVQNPRDAQRERAARAAGPAATRARVEDPRTARHDRQGR